MDKKSEIGKEIKERMDTGKIVPSAYTVGLLKKSMEENGWGKTYLIDGFPRNQENLEVWNSLMSSIVNFKCLLFFDVSTVLL